MIKKILREFYLLPRGEQRAMILLSLLMIFSLGIRITVQMLPGREPPGMELFLKESREIMATLAEADSLNRLKQDSLVCARSKPFPSSPWKSYDQPSIPDHSINLNTVDSAGLLPLPGIGPVFAGRIVRYRHLLGGYVNTDQLSEVYGLKHETIQRITPLLYMNTKDIEMLRMNSAGFGELLRHPYLGYGDVKTLVKYRDVQGRIGSLEEIREHGLLPDSTLGKIRPYLDFTY